MRERRSAARERSDRLWYWLLASAVLASAIALIPVVYVGGAVDAFRLPKELGLRTEAIALAVLGVFAATAPRLVWRDVLAIFSRSERILLAAIAVWSVVTTVMSTNRPLSVESLFTIATTFIIYIATRLVAPRLRLPALYVVFAGALANAIVVTLQETRVWNPFVFPPEITGHYQSVGLLGNANDVGSLLAGPAVVALIAAVTVRGWHRLSFGAIAIVLFTGVAMSQTRTAMIAFGAGVFVAALLRPWRQAVAVAAILIAFVIIALRPGTGVRQNFDRIAIGARTRDYTVLFSERVVPFLCAIDMVRAHPLTGVGPGCFKYHFMMTRLELQKRYPPQWTRGWPMNFGETHNDHLQIAAETGLPGYALFLSAALLLAIPARRRRDREVTRTAEQTLAHAFRAPLAATFFVLALAQFPLQIAAPRLLYVTLGALALSWDDRDA